MNLSVEAPRFDWYSATVEGHAGSLVEVLATALADERPVPCRPLARYGWGMELRVEGSKCAVVYGGGPDPRGHVVASGSDAPALARVLRSPGFPSHAVSRCDVAVDTDTPGSFLAWQAALRERLSPVVKARSIVPDDPEDGSTYYVGSPASEAQARLYEKGRQQPGSGRPHWVRYELQVRPEKARRTWAAQAPPLAILGASRWGRRFAEEVLGLAVGAPPVRTARVSDLEGGLEAAAAQYGGRFLESLEKHGGDVEAFALDLLARVQLLGPQGVRTGWPAALRDAG